MADIVSKGVRSRMMAGIRSKDTKPELTVRRGLHALGFRFRLHDKALPGRPDLVFPKYRAVIQIHGCYWHGHECAVGHLPADGGAYWGPKIAGNRERDARNEAALDALGWRQLTVWECALRGKARKPESAVISACAGWLTSGSPSAYLST